jgi:quercetin dioxygenase-like cupin family protein
VRTDTDHWSAGPRAVFAPHEHPFHKTLTCEAGSIEFIIPGPPERRVLLKAGETLELPAGTSHRAAAGPDGVTCSELHRYP